MNIYLATDHAGYELKEVIKQYLEREGYKVVDCGAHTYDQNDDYPDFVQIAAKKVSQNKGFGIVFGKSGAGEAIVANKFPDIRAILAVNTENVKLSREHNDANILSLGSALVNSDMAKELVSLFLETSFSNEERHKRRIEKIRELEHAS